MTDPDRPSAAGPEARESASSAESAEIEFLHIDPDDFLLDSFRLGRKVFESGFRPKHVLSIWRGGTPVGLGVDAFFRMRGVFFNHTTIATESYTGVQQQGEVTVKGLEHVVEVVCPEDGLLIVDDVLESGRTIEKILEHLRRRTRANMPRDIRVATVHRKPERVRFEGPPVISLYDVPGDVWIDYPHELAELVEDGDASDARIRNKNEDVWNILHGPMPEREKLEVDGPYLAPSARELLLDSIRLGRMVAEDESFRPDFLVALWPGGIDSGLPVHEVFKWVAKKQSGATTPDHISLTTARTRTSYHSEIIGIHYLVERVENHHDVLIVDTTFRSGQVVNDVLMKLKEVMRRNLDPKRVRVASVYHNPEDTSTWTVPRVISGPHYWVRQVDCEIVYPHSIQKLPDPHADLRRVNPKLHEIVFGAG